MYSECLLRRYAGKLRLNARRPAKSTPTYEQLTQWLLQIQMRHFHQMDLLSIYGKRTE